MQRRLWSLVLTFAAAGCGGGGSAATGEAPAGSGSEEPAAPAAPTPSVATSAAVDGSVECLAHAGDAGWTLSTWATVILPQRLPAAGGAPEPFPGMPANGLFPEGHFFLDCVVPSPDGARVAYGTSSDFSAVSVRVRPADGSGADTVIGQGIPLGWSADGSEVFALTHTGGPRAVVALASVGGGAPRVVWQSAADRVVSGVDVSSDATMLAIASAPASNPAASDLLVVTLGDDANAEPRTLTSDGLGNLWPVFTADGRGVVHTSRRGGDVDIWVVSVSGGEPKLVLEAPGVESALAFSIDGRTLRYGVRASEPSHVAVRMPPGSGARMLEETISEDALQVSLSPDGHSVAFARGAGAETNIYVQSLAGGDAQPKVTAPGTDSSPAFSPDGRSLAYLGTRDGATEVYLLPLAGGGAQRITNGSGAIPGRRLAFSPDSQRLAVTRLVDGVPTLSILPLGGGELVNLVARPRTYIWENTGRTLLVASSGAERAVVQRLKADGTGRPEAVRAELPALFQFLALEVARGRQTKALLHEDTDRERLIRVDLVRGQREVLAELPANVDLHRFSMAATPDASTLVTTEAIVASEVREVTNAGDVVSALLR